MVRTRGLAAALVSGIALLAAGLVPAQAKRAAKTPRQEEIAAKLDTIKISLDFHDAALPDVLDFIRSFSGIDFMLDPAVRERHGEEQLKITMKVNDLPLRSALRLMLHGKGLTAVCREGVLVVVPREEAEKHVVLRIYDVRDLMMKLEDNPGPCIALRPPGEGAGIKIDDYFEEWKEPPKTEFILEMIRKNCGGTSWEENPNASITFNNGLLMVNQTPRVHAEVAGMIGKLRQYR
jgi:hypothetical protein